MQRRFLVLAILFVTLAPGPAMAQRGFDEGARRAHAEAQISFILQITEVTGLDPVDLWRWMDRLNGRLPDDRHVLAAIEHAAGFRLSAAQRAVILHAAGEARAAGFATAIQR